MKKVIYPGSFNPITYGHVNIVERGLELFDHMVVGIGTSIDKDPNTYLKDRIRLCRESLESFGDRVNVVGFNGLLVDFVKSNDTRFVLRGLRTLTDYDYEFQMLEMNRQIEPSLEYVLLPTSQKWSHLSSTRVREIAALGGDVSPFVPPCVSEYYRDKHAIPD